MSGDVSWDDIPAAEWNRRVRSVHAMRDEMRERKARLEKEAWCLGHQLEVVDWACGILELEPEPEADKVYAEIAPATAAQKPAIGTSQKRALPNRHYTPSWKTEEST